MPGPGGLTGAFALYRHGYLSTPTPNLSILVETVLSIMGDVQLDLPRPYGLGCLPTIHSYFLHHMGIPSLAGMNTLYHCTPATYLYTPAHCTTTYLPHTPHHTLPALP